MGGAPPTTTTSPGRPLCFHLRGLGQPSRGLIRRGCAWRTPNIWIPARPSPALPRPSRARRRRRPFPEGLQPGFARVRGNPACNAPRSKPVPRETAFGYDQYCLSFYK